MRRQDDLLHGRQPSDTPSVTRVLPSAAPPPPPRALCWSKQDPRLPPTCFQGDWDPGLLRGGAGGPLGVWLSWRERAGAAPHASHVAQSSLLSTQSGSRIRGERQRVPPTPTESVPNVGSVVSGQGTLW